MTNAWVTYADSKLYVEAAKVLFKSLQLYNTSCICILMIPDTFCSYALGDIPAYIQIKAVSCFDVSSPAHAQERYKSCSNKIHCWTLVDYEKVCWLDCDIVVTRNIDELFDINIGFNEIAAAQGCRCNIFNNPSLPTLPDLCPFLNASCTYINAGVILLRPSLAIFEQLKEAGYNHPFAEQDTFNLFFANNIRVIDSKYNYLNHLHIAHPNVATSDICIYHFGYGKPWETDISPHIKHGAQYYDNWNKVALLLQNGSCI